MNKYGNKKAVRNGIIFDSQKEAARYDQLMLRWLPVVEDVKGFRTKEYELKKKLMAGRGIHVVEV